jgi:hypothetical protein
MTIDEMIEYWRGRLKHQEDALANAPAALREELFRRDVFPYMEILRS